MAQRFRIEVEPNPKGAGGDVTIMVHGSNERAGLRQLELSPTLGVRVVQDGQTQSLAPDAWVESEWGRLRVLPLGEPLMSGQAYSGWATPQLEVCLAGVLPGRGFQVALPREEGREVVLGRGQPSGDLAAGGAGAAGGIDVAIDDPHVSRRHLAIVRREGAYVASNLGTHGTTLDGRPLLEPARLEHNAVLVLGTTRVVFRSFDSVLLALGDGQATTPGPAADAPPASTSTPTSPPFTAAPMPLHAGQARSWLSIAICVLGILLLALVVLGVRIASS